MAIALMVHKDEYTLDELKQLADAPYFGAYLVRAKDTSVQTKERRGSSTTQLQLKDFAESDFLPSGTPVRSHGIAPSTRKRFEMLIKAELPIVSHEEPSHYMEAPQLRALLKKHPELQFDNSVSWLYKLLVVVSDLGFRAGWCEDLPEKTIKGWR